ncbi:MAG: hypothetical protein K2P92_00225 [Bdellovibrionaceae bacterium]|nr:hypothetical protein [Pseudobdellovibrionaceae bacterium]
MLKNDKSKSYKKALIITRNAEISAISHFILKRRIFCLTMNSAPDAKHIFKNSQATRVLILDWSLQDKFGSIFKCLVEAKARKKIFVVNIFMSTDQKRWLFEKLPRLKENNKIYNVSNDFQAISLILTLMKIKKRLTPDSAV